MKTPLSFLSFSTCLIGLLAGTVHHAYAAHTPVLRYRFAPGQTNVYKIEVEIRGENGTEGLAGNILVTPKAGPSNVICLALRGSLMPKRDGPMRPPYFGGGNYPRWMSPVSLGDGCEIQLDDRGHLLRLAGDYALPIPLGSVAQLLIEPLPAASDSRWDITDELAVLDEPLGLGPAAAFAPAQPYGMPYYNGSFNQRGGSAVVAATRKIHCEIKSSATDQITVSKHLALESRLQFGAEPRISSTGDGEFVLDHKNGMLTRAETQFKTVVNTETLTRRTTGNVRITLLEGEPRETALQQLAPPSNRPPRKLTAEEIQKVIQDLKSTDDATRTKAASLLQSSELTEAPPALLELLSALLNDSDTFTKMAAAKIIADYGTAEQVPALLKLLKSDDTSTRWSAIRGLGRLKDKRAAEPLAALLATGGSDGYQAVEALTKIGPDAEDAVLFLLKEKNTETRRQTCNVLKQIGTKKSVEPLRELMLDTDQSVNSSAAEAVRAIMARQ